MQPVAALAARTGDGVAVGQPQAGGALRRLARVPVAPNPMADGGNRPGVRRRFVRGGGNASGRRLRVVSSYCRRLLAGHGVLDSVQACHYHRGPDAVQLVVVGCLFGGAGRGVVGYAGRALAGWLLGGDGLAGCRFQGGLVSAGPVVAVLGRCALRAVAGAAGVAGTDAGCGGDGFGSGLVAGRRAGVGAAGAPGLGFAAVRGAGAGGFRRVAVRLNRRLMVSTRAMGRCPAGVGRRGWGVLPAGCRGWSVMLRWWFGFGGLGRYADGAVWCARHTLQTARQTAACASITRPVSGAWMTAQSHGSAGSAAGTGLTSSMLSSFIVTDQWR